MARPIPFRRRLRFTAGDLRLMTLGGLFIGLVAAQLPAVEAQPQLQAQPAALRVVDGDTFWYQGVKIRVADIDTPEVAARCPAEARLAARATDRMRELLAAGPFELHRIDRDEDRYGRKLRVVTRDGHSLGDQLVAEGLARTWTGRREPWCA